MTEPNLNAIAADGRWGLSQSPYSYSVIAIDAYRPPYIPWHLTTVQFFGEVKEHLDPDGVLVINVGRTPEDRRLIEAMVGTLRPVFPSVHVVDVPGTFNSMVYATVQPTEADFLRENLEAMGGEGPEFLRLMMGRAAANLKPTPAAAVVFTDDRAPVERLVNSIVINYVVGDATDILPEVLQ